MIYVSIIDNESIWAKERMSGARVDYLWGLKEAQGVHGHAITVSGSQIYFRGISGANAILSGSALIVY